MKNTNSLKYDLLKEIAIALLCILLAIGTMVYAKAEKPVHSSIKPDTTNNISPTKAISPEEEAFYQEIEAYYQKEFASRRKRKTINRGFASVVVYNLEGEVLQTQNGEIDLAQLPKNAQRFFVEGNTAYYLVL